MNTLKLLEKLRPRACSRLRALPVFGPVLDDLMNWFQGHGYARSSLQNHIHGVDELSRWLQRRPGKLTKLSQEHLHAAYEYHRTRKPHVACTIHAVGRFLRERSLIPEGPKPPVSASERQLELFGAYLREMRGLAALTVLGHQCRLRFFLRFLKFDKHLAALRKLRMDQIDGFLRQMAKTNNRFSLQHVVASLRSFLRYHHACGVIKEPLHQQIDTPRTYRLEQLPKALPWEQVVALLRSIDRSEAYGLRDFTILYLAARYGLRSGELVRLTLDHVDWQAGILQVPQSKTRQVLQLPLTDEAGSVLTRYLQAGRPASERRELFLRQRAPAGVLAHTAVHDILEYRIRRSGLELPPCGTHVLRHSFAVHLLRQGVPIGNIGDALGHRDSDSTAVYLRLAVDDLRAVGLPIPKTAQPAKLDPSGWKQKLPKSRTGKKRPRLARMHLASGLAASLRAYLATRRALGRRFTLEENILRRWDDFLSRHYRAARVVSPEMFNRWAQTMPGLTANVRRSHLRVVRNFLLFHARNHSKTYLPDLATFPKPCPYLTPRLVTPAEMGRVLATAQRLPPSHTNPVRAQTVHLALVLLFCCGLRRGELLRLQLRHFDGKEAVLRIEATKFHKSRLVPLAASVAQEMRSFVELRRRHRLPVHPDSPLLWNNRRPAPDDCYCAVALNANWQQLCLAAGILDGQGRPPRLHDLRHSFAVSALHRWYQQGVEVQAKLPHLATYLGHVCAVSTHHYLHLTPDLRAAASQRFHQYALDLFGEGGGK
jgi:integrase/recombinase XerD